MLMHAPAGPSPLAQVTVYMVGILLGHALLTPTEELQRAWNAVRSFWSRPKH